MKKFVTKLSEPISMKKDKSGASPLRLAPDLSFLSHSIAGAEFSYISLYIKKNSEESHDSDV
jgi:hypothetical protein